jgi:PAS domain S-box-containing protein
MTDANNNDSVQDLLEENKNLKIEVGLMKDGFFQLKKTSEALDLSRNFNNELIKRDEAILQSISDAVFVIDTNGLVILVNKVAETLSGVSAATAIGKDYKEIFVFVSEKNENQQNDFIFEALNSKKITKMVNHTLLKRIDGSSIPVKESAAPVLTKDGNILGCVVVFYDATKEREIDKAKTEFVSVASHQLRTPLTALSWLSDALLSDKENSLNLKQLKYLFEISKATKRMTLLVDSLLNVSRIELGSLTVTTEELSVEKVYQTSLIDLEKQITEKNLQLVASFPEDGSNMLADPKLLQIVFENLLSNAVKYTLEGGKISFTFIKEAARYLITIIDNGLGIDEADQPKLFQKMFRADNAKITDPDGTGLGLYIVKSIVEQTGGEIWLSSKLNLGTTFYISWPLSGMLSKSGGSQLI